MKGLPEEWMHARDELYDRMRGPAENLTVLATAYSDLEMNKSTWEPVAPGTPVSQQMDVVVEETTVGGNPYIEQLAETCHWLGFNFVTVPPPMGTEYNSNTSSIT